MPELWANLGLMQQETGDIASAIPSFQQANHLNPSLYVPNLFLGIDSLRTGKAPEAIPFLIKAEKINKTDPADAACAGTRLLRSRQVLRCGSGIYARNRA
jgi:tetratricopeptide (TPR) repeat protein